MANSYITYQCFFDGKIDLDGIMEQYTMEIVSEKTLTQKEIKELILGEFLIVRNLKAYRKK